MERKNSDTEISHLSNISDSDDFYEYRLLMIEEAEFILSNKREYIQEDFLPDNVKILRICALMDFFILEDETSVVIDLESMENIMRLKKFIRNKDF